MIQVKRSWHLLLGVLVGASSIVACTIEPAPRQPLNESADDKIAAEEPVVTTDPIEPEVNEATGAFGKTTPATGTLGVTGTPGTRKYCGGELGEGDLAIVEIMIASKTGSADTGEWVEIQNTKSCWLKLKGVTVESPRGATLTPDSATIVEDLELAPGATFVVAGSLDPLRNGALPGTVIAFSSTDVLKNGGDTISVRTEKAVLDTVTYPSIPDLVPGQAIVFPADCTGSARSDWSSWTRAVETYGPALRGTPNTKNADVSCR